MTSPVETNQAFELEYQQAIDRFTEEFGKNYCTPEGAIIWEKVVELSSGDRGNAK